MRPQRRCSVGRPRSRPRSRIAAERRVPPPIQAEAERRADHVRWLRWARSSGKIEVCFVFVSKLDFPHFPWVCGGMMEQAGDRTATGTARTPVALRIARQAAQVLLASGILTREVRQDAEIAKQDAPRSLRLGGLLLSIYQTRTTPAVPERAPKRGEPCRIPPRHRPHFSISRARADNCGMPACPARRNGMEGWRPGLVKCGKSS